MTPETRTVFLVDDDPLMLFLWERILLRAGHRVEAFEQPEKLLRRLTPSDRGCVVVDLRMPGLDGLDLQRALKDADVLLPLIFVSGSVDVPAMMSAMKGGAVDFLSKPVDLKEFCALVERALRKDAEATERRARERSRSRWMELSPREQHLCRLLAKGLSSKQIAEELGWAEGAVQSECAAMFQRLEVGTPRELFLLLSQITGGL